KGNEDKRGQTISNGIAEKNWLYLNGKPVICNRHMEVAAMVSAINPSINSTMDSSEMASIQQALLWLLHDMGYLSKYPMALGNLGDLEEISQSPGRPPPLTLFQESIDADKRYYDNQHVYPYTYMGAFLFRNGQYKAALSCWSNASAVMKGYEMIFYFIVLFSKLIYYTVAFSISSIFFLSEKFFKSIG
ncbi:menin-like, partial [Octopus sinensis]|uniref:Menin n=1 Tax=Octopus sinensis TaxID=2607531 RepID=A0A6P7U3U4_9MOLL